MFKQQRRRVRSGIAGALVVLGLVVAAAVVGLQLWGSPFTTTTVDHSLPPVVVQLRDLADFHAAQGQFEVTVDQEHDVKWVPSAIAGERVQYAAIGTVDAVVEFGALPDGAVQMSADGTTAVVTLPRAHLMAPVLDQEHSHVMNRDRGLLNRVSGVFSDNPTSEHDLEMAASQKLADAAAATDLRDRAESNTRSMLTSMLHGAGVEHVEVHFEGASQSVA
jgi:hypothetical protein